MKLHKILCSCSLTYRVWSTSKRHTEIKLLPHREHRRLNYKDWSFNIIQSLIIVRVTRNTYTGLLCVCVCVCVHGAVAAACCQVQYWTLHNVHRIMYRHVFSIITTTYSDYFPKQRRQFTVQHTTVCDTTWTPTVTTHAMYV